MLAASGKRNGSSARSFLHHQPVNRGASHCRRQGVRQRWTAGHRADAETGSRYGTPRPQRPEQCSAHGGLRVQGWSSSGHAGGDGSRQRHGVQHQGWQQLRDWSTISATVGLHRRLRRERGPASVSIPRMALLWRRAIRGRTWAEGPRRACLIRWLRWISAARNPNRNGIISWSERYA